MVIRNLFLVIILAFTFLSCDKEVATNPYSIFQDTSYQEFQNNSIEVDISAYYELVIQSGFNEARPRYLLQKDQAVPQDLSETDQVKIEKHGWNGKQGLKFERARIHFDFKEEEYQAGEELKLIVRHSGLEEVQILKVK
ncbi:MAG: hypothetical protein AAGG68_04070 [Bacteroidota bacterium]